MPHRPASELDPLSGWSASPASCPTCAEYENWVRTAWGLLVGIDRVTAAAPLVAC
jgi:hypothetical protein